MIIFTLSFSATNESLNTIVNFEALNGIWVLFISKALMHYLSANKLLFIYAPSNLLCLLLLWQSWALSDPARSTTENLPTTQLLFLITIWQIAWDLEEVSFVDV